MLAIGDFLFHCNKKYTPKNGGQTVLYWQCERRADLQCMVTVNLKPTSNEIFWSYRRKPKHTHAASRGRVEGLSVTYYSPGRRWTSSWSGTRGTAQRPYHTSGCQFTRQWIRSETGDSTSPTKTTYDWPNRRQRCADQQSLDTNSGRRKLVPWRVQCGRRQGIHLCDKEEFGET